MFNVGPSNAITLTSHNYSTHIFIMDIFLKNIFFYKVVVLIEPL